MDASLSQNHGGMCIVCYSDFANKTDPNCEPISLDCKHEFCLGCWKDHLKEIIVNGNKKSLKAPCQQNGCNLVVPHSMFGKIFGEGKKTGKSRQDIEDNQIYNKYMRWHCQSFTDDNKNVKWCPYSKECDYAAERVSDTQYSNIVNCICRNSFCFRCGHEQHRPADCDMFKEWELKNSSESENLNWIIANTKMCPNKTCQRPIEKNQGCNHITCKLCAHEFCWICLGEWKEHNSTTGGYYKCNKFDEKDPNLTEAHKRQENAKFELNRYIFYFERYNNHFQSEKLARDLRPVMTLKIKQLHELKHYPQIELEFLYTGVEEIIKCR